MFTANLVALGIPEVYIRLVGVDLTQLSDYDLLPISSDMEVQIVQNVYNILVQAPPADKAKLNND